ncbi:MAG: 3',5'-cyclic-nucleotide phosphodiesterase pde1 [Watsoniomyces obsoletus]|nr:MAG: 3',5'-cyclic-nucleotide phosphodiesterase pde1 [Watsoniomyces obsoletus]
MRKTNEGVARRARGTTSQPVSEEAALQVIILGSGGGPAEDDVTGFLVRSTATQWAKGSLLAVDAGTHLAAIARILEDQVLAENTPTENNGTGISNAPPSDLQLRNGIPAPRRTLRSKKIRGNDSTSNGNPAIQSTAIPSSSSSAERSAVSHSNPFAGLNLPADNPRANAAYITRELVSTYLITHAHLDHIAGFVINTASFQHTARPKRLAAMEGTISAIKTHIFNDLIWPNLTDEEGGVGLVSFMRLVEGGDVAIGEGDGRGYIEVCDGLGVKSWSVSHGHRSNSTKRRQMSHPHLFPLSHPHSPHLGPHAHPHSPHLNSPHTHPLFHHHHHQYFGHRGSAAGGDPLSMSMQGGDIVEKCAYDSTAYFIRDFATGSEVLIFGDVEPDQISSEPRTRLVWQEAAPKIARGLLKGVLIECSYDDSQSDETLFGHLAPRHLYRELRYLGECVRDVRRNEVRTDREGGGMINKKRKRRGESRGSTASGVDAEIRALSVRRRHSSYQQQQQQRRGGSGTSNPAVVGLQEQEQVQKRHQDRQQSPVKQKPKRSKRGGLEDVAFPRPASAGAFFSSSSFVASGEEQNEVPKEAARRSKLPPLLTKAGGNSISTTTKDTMMEDTLYPRSNPVDVDDDEEEEEERVNTSVNEAEAGEGEAATTENGNESQLDENEAEPTITAEETKDEEEDLPLKGLKIIIMHMKDPFRWNLTTGPNIGQSILERLEGYENGTFVLETDDEDEDEEEEDEDGEKGRESGKGGSKKGKERERGRRMGKMGRTEKLGCEFIISERGQSIWL